jgi:hypothetical protein
VKRKWAVVALVVALVAAAAVLGSPVYCPMMGGWDSCEALPTCSAGYVNYMGPSGSRPGASCESRFFH